MAGRKSEGLTEQLGPRVQPEELQMLRDISAHLATSGNRSIRWAIRYAWQHATSTDDHTLCTRNSPCGSATRGLTAPVKAPRAGYEGQTAITHQATMGDQT